MNSTEKQYLETKQKEAINDLKEHGELARVIVVRLADATAALIQHGYLEGKLADVCSIVLKIIAKEEINCHPKYARRCMRKEYKHVEFDSSGWDELSERNQGSALPDVDEKTAADDEILDGVRKYEDAVIESSRRKNAYTNKAQSLRSEAIRRKLSLKKEEMVTSTEDDPGVSNSHTAMVKLVAMMDALAAKLYKFKPKPEVDQEIAREIENLFLVLRPMIDEKWTDSLPYWFRIQILNVAFGKHAAGSMGSTKTPEGIDRKFTREQVGDRRDTIVEMAARIIHDTMPSKDDYMIDVGNGVLKFDEDAYNAVCEEILKKAEQYLGPEGVLWLYVLCHLWHKKSVAPRIAKRKVKMHDQFSESS